MLCYPRARALTKNLASAMSLRPERTEGPKDHKLGYGLVFSHRHSPEAEEAADAF